MEKLVQENHSYKGKGGLTLQMRKRLVSAARCAIRMRSAEPDHKKAVKYCRETSLMDLSTVLVCIMLVVLTFAPLQGKQQQQHD